MAEAKKDLLTVVHQYATLGLALFAAPVIFIYQHGEAEKEKTFTRIENKLDEVVRGQRDNSIVIEVHGQRLKDNDRDIHNLQEDVKYLNSHAVLTLRP